MSVIPDSIEPVVGWRSYRLVGDVLHSATARDFVWTPGEPAEAKCQCQGAPEFRWELTRGTGDPYEVWQRFQQLQAASAAYQPVQAAAAQSIHVTNPHYGMVLYDPPKPPDPPKTSPPSGFQWTLAPEAQTAPQNGHACGIYIAGSKDIAASYGGDVLAKVAGWGKVIRHSHGWRCQYAYPQVLYVADEVIAAKLEHYSVPVKVDEELPVGASGISIGPGGGITISGTTIIAGNGPSRPRPSRLSAYFAAYVVGAAALLNTAIVLLGDSPFNAVFAVICAAVSGACFAAGYSRRRPS